MKNNLTLLIIPILSFGQNTGYVTETVQVINSFGGIYDDIFSLDLKIPSMTAEVI